MEDKIITCPKCGSRHVASMPCVFTGILDEVYQLFCKDCGQMFEKTGLEIKEHFEEKSKQFTCPYCKGHDVMLIDKYTNNIYEVWCKSCGKLLVLTPDTAHEEKENNTMKCQRCGKEMRNTIGGCYTCDECGFGINDLVDRSGRGIRTNELPDDMQKAFYDALNSDRVLLNNSIDNTNIATTITDGLATKSNTGKSTIFDKSVFHNSDYIDSPVKGRTETTTISPCDTPSNIGTVTIPKESIYPEHGWVQQGWQCPKCGAILSPHTPFCPFCSRQTITPTVTCGTSGSGEYINPNTSITISKSDK